MSSTHHLHHSHGTPWSSGAPTFTFDDAGQRSIHRELFPTALSESSIRRNLARVISENIAEVKPEHISTAKWQKASNDLNSGQVGASVLTKAFRDELELTDSPSSLSVWIDVRAVNESKTEPTDRVPSFTLTVCRQHGDRGMKHALTKTVTGSSVMK